MNDQFEEFSTILISSKEKELSLAFGQEAVQSKMRIDAPNELVLDYTRELLGWLLFQPNPQKIAMIGLGGGSIAKYCNAHLPHSQFTAVEISQEVIGLRDKFQIPADSVRFKVLHADGAIFIRDSEENALDIIMVDAFDRQGQPASLSSLDFYSNCFAALSHDGVLAINFCATDSSYLTYIDRLRNVFGDQVVGCLTDDGTNASIFAFRKKTLPLTLQKIAQNLPALEVKHDIELYKTATKLLKNRL